MKTPLAIVCLVLAACAAANAPVHGMPPRQSISPEWVGAQTCAGCHRKQHAEWRGSHHDLAMQPANESTVLGDFDGAEFEYNGITTRFFRRNGEYWVHTDGPDGEPGDYRAPYVFGVEPLQQYLLELPGGRLQALSIAWDTRPPEVGGQRWFHLYPHENIAAGDPLHWTGPYMNWNARCADCHSTNLQKNVLQKNVLHKNPVQGSDTQTSRARDRSEQDRSEQDRSEQPDTAHANLAPYSPEYQTTWSETDVSCEACHGPGARHVALASRGRVRTEANGGFDVSLSNRTRWRFEGDDPIARPVSAPEARPQQVEVCGWCHSRRGPLGVPWRFSAHSPSGSPSHFSSHFSSTKGRRPHGISLLDTHRPSLLEPGLYHADGQILDEVYVYGSFVQSRMYQAGVVCADCHEPHNLELRLPGNQVCSQCHRADVFDTPAHHHHPPESAGAACVNCHMPATTYMVVDPRRDHSLRVPRPDLAAAIGAPNACNTCHADRDEAWAMDALRGWGVSFPATDKHPGRVLHRARGGDAGAVPGLRELALDENAAPILRATAMVELGELSGRDAHNTSRLLLNSDDPMLRLGAVRSLASAPPELRLALLGGRLEPSVTEPAVAAPSVSGSSATEGSAGESAVAETSVTERSVAEPPVAGRSATEPSATASTTEPSVAELSAVEPSTAVRMEMARVLAPVPIDAVEPHRAEALASLFRDYVSTLERHGDMPEIQVELGLFYTAQQQWEKAEAAYNRALSMQPRSLLALLNLADLYRLLGREDESRQQLLKATESAPDEGAPYHALGLLETRAGNRAAALQHLERAARMEADASGDADRNVGERRGTRYRYVYAVALHDSGKPEEALAELRKLLRAAPGSRDVLVALLNYNRELGRLEEARRYAQELLRLDPFPR